MFNLSKAITVLEAAVYCDSRSCGKCYKIYGMQNCPFGKPSPYLEDAKELLMALKEYEEVHGATPAINKSEIFQLLDGVMK